MPHAKRFIFHRVEQRIPMEIPVLIDGHRDAPGSESTFTENVSARGARVVSARRWEHGEPLVFASRTGEFRSRPGLLTANHCKATALPLAWSSSSRKDDGLFNPQDSWT